VEFGIRARLDRPNARITQNLTASPEIGKSKRASQMRRLRIVGVASREDAVAYAVGAGSITNPPAPQQ
jgi:hypothetical protein